MTVANERADALVETLIGGLARLTSEPLTEAARHDGDNFRMPAAVLRTRPSSCVLMTIALTA